MLSVGRSGRAEARWLLPKICDAGGITKDGIGAIRVQEDRTFVQISDKLAGKFGATLELESGVMMERIAGEPDLDRPERAPAKRAPRADKAEYTSREKPEYTPREKPAYEAREKPAYVPKPARIVEDEGGYDPMGASYTPPAEAPAPRPERKPYAKREDTDRKPYAPRAEGAKPYAPRAEGAKPYSPRDAIPYAPRAEGAKPYAPRAEGAKPHAPRADGAKPYAKRDDSDRKPYAPRAAKPADGDRKPYAPRDAKPSAPRSAGFKSHGGADAGKATGFKSHAAEGKPARPKADAKDTSKRFVPPGKPMGKPKR